MAMHPTHSRNLSMHDIEAHRAHKEHLEKVRQTGDPNEYMTESARREEITEQKRIMKENEPRGKFITALRELTVPAKATKADREAEGKRAQAVESAKRRIKELKIHGKEWE